MSWYSAHAILYVQYKSGAQTSFPVWENVYLIEADSSEAALEQAKARALEDEGDSGGTFMWDDRAAEWVFAGIRKIISVSHLESEGNLSSGDELTYSQLRVNSLQKVKSLAAGDIVQTIYDE